MDTLVAGTIQTYSVELGDRLNNVADLAPYACQFKVLSEDETVIAQNWTSASPTGMRVDCLINTTGWIEGIYKLYVRINIPPETPILGPIDFAVS